ncbi:MAG: glutamine--tRNA ligase/YqeY domain fusion protein [Acidobacteriota bacterium]
MSDSNDRTHAAPLPEATAVTTTSSDFIRERVSADVAAGKAGGRVATRFPPEPNGYLHIGHAKSICLNFGVAAEWKGTCNLRFDDTNPLTEDPEYVQSIEDDVRWLGFDWQERKYFASDYFERLYQCAVELIERDLAYVDSLSDEEIREFRGTVTEAGRASPHRTRSVAENLNLFARMRAGEFADGAHVLRAKIDMAAANMKMRDPLLYRIRHAAHHRTGDAWVIYPLYDFTHCISDAIENITHSLCTLEFENNRELYDWILDRLWQEPRPRQIEFARLNLTYTVLSKRVLLKLVSGGHVAGWDDPRLPTLSGLRRRGYTPTAIRRFCEEIGVAKANSTVDVAQLEHAIRDDLNRTAPRVLCVLRPLKVVIENYPEGKAEEFDAPYFPDDVGLPGSRPLPFSREIWIERDDFSEVPPKGFHRLSLGNEVRLRYAYLIRCTGVLKDELTGEITEVRCTYDPDTRGGSAPDGRRVKSTLHWVSAKHALPVEVRLYDRLFAVERPETSDEVLLTQLNPDSLVTLNGWIEPASTGADRYQFERQGFFFLDPIDSGSGRRAFNRTVTLRDSWVKESTVEAAPRRAAKPAPKAGVAAEAVVSDPLSGLDDATRARAGRYRDAHHLPLEQARLLAAPEVASLFESALAAGGSPAAVGKWIVNELPREAKERSIASLPFGGGEIAELATLVEDGAISWTAGKEILAQLVARGGQPRALMTELGLEQVEDESAIVPVIERLLAEHPENVAAYRSGKVTLLGWFIGQAMKSTGGKAKPELVQQLLRERL